MSGTLRSERVLRVLAELRRQAEMEDAPAKARVRARTVVEFGASLGFSTIHLAAAVCDLAVLDLLEPARADRRDARGSGPRTFRSVACRWSTAADP